MTDQDMEGSRLSLLKRYETNLEKTMREELERRGLKFAQEFPTRTGFIIDFAFPDLKIAIECDGERWHSSKKSKRKLLFRDYMLRREGWKVFHFSGKDIMNDICKCVDKVMSCVVLCYVMFC